MPSEIVITPPYRDVLRSLALDTPDAIFSGMRLRVWRDLEDRDNSTLDATLADGRTIRLHVKRDKRKRREPMALEASGIQLLESAGIRSSPLVAHGRLGERTFVVTENLDGYLSADRLLETGVERRPILRAMSEVAAKLHNAGLHHRDLYANHFYLRPSGEGYEVRLIDTARVRKLPVLFRERWIVKDVAQLFFSAHPYFNAEASAAAMMADYMAATGRGLDASFQRRVDSKIRWIDRHDRALRARKPQRNLRLADGN